MESCIIYNPAAGRGRAQRLIERLRHRGTAFDLRATAGPTHGAELAQRAIQAGHTRIIAAGGDGTVHEVANGVLGAGRPEIVFGVWPIGSANDYAYALGVHGDWPLNASAESTMRIKIVDVGRVTGGDRGRFFVNGLGLGFNSAVTLESQSIGRLRGKALYGLAFVRALWRHYEYPRLQVTVDGQTFEQPTLALTVNLGTREGGFLVTPRADLSDGLFDVVHAGALSRPAALALLPRLAQGALPAEHPLIWQSRCRHVVVRGREPLRIHIDGEFFCHRDAGITEVAIELLPARLRVLTPAER
jgi:diacylglycerol kinase family enzyme